MACAGDAGAGPMERSPPWEGGRYLQGPTLPPGRGCRGRWVRGAEMLVGDRPGETVLSSQSELSGAHSAIWLLLQGC